MREYRRRNNIWPGNWTPWRLRHQERTHLRGQECGATTARPDSRKLTHPRDGDVLIVHTLDRLGRTVRDTLNMVHDLKERGAGARTLADPLAIDTAKPDSPLAQWAFVMLALLGQMERTCAPNHAAAAPSRPQPLQPTILGLLETQYQFDEPFIAARSRTG